MKFTGKINSLEEWIKVAPPMHPEKQWKDGFSAKELAKYLIEENDGRMPLGIENVIGALDFSDNEFYWEAEYKTKLSGQGGQRTHDLAIFSDNAFIGVEAKVNEPYGKHKDISAWLKDTTGDGLNKRKRLCEMCKLITREEEYKRYETLRYQLLSGLAGTIAETINKKKKIAIFLIIDFLVNRENECEINQYDFNNFCAAFGINNDISKCTGETVFFGKVNTAPIDTYVAKILVRKDEL